MILSDVSIRQLLKDYPDFIYPEPEDEQIQPASIDLNLGNEIRSLSGSIYNMMNKSYFILLPGHFVLGQTKQFVRVPPHLVGQLNGKSSLGRQGLMVHSTAGYIDPGFNGNITLELANIGNESIFLTENMLIAQLVLIQLTEPARRPYGSKGLNSHYQNQTGATLSWLNQHK